MPSEGMARLDPDVMKEARKRKGWSQQQFAEIMGVTTNTIQNWESGRRQAPRELEKFIKLCDELDVSADVLLGRRHR